MNGKVKHIIVILALLYISGIITLTACTSQDPGDGTATPGDATPAGNNGDNGDNGNGGNGSSNSGDSSNNATPAAGQPLTMEADMGINVGGTWYPILQDAAGLLQALGDDYEYSSAPSCVYEGEDKEFLYSHASVHTNPDGQRDIWYLIVLMDGTLQTSRGVKTGDSFDDITAAYGENYYYDSEDMIVYSISGIKGDIGSPCIIFTLEDNIIILIEIYYPTLDLD